MAATLFLLGSASGTPPTRSLPILSKQPAFCQKQLGTNYLWLAQADMACLGFPATGCGGAGTPCGWLSVNGQRLNITNANADDHDVCGTCQGCPTWFIGFDASIPNEAHVVEGQVADITYHPPPAQAPVEEVEPDTLPDCPTLPSPWKTLADKQISPACSPSESQGSLGVTASADACLAKAKANGAVNYALWRGDTDGSCQACAFRWRGPAENFQFSDLSGATSFVWYISLPPPVPSGPCPACPPNPEEEPPRGARLATLSNGRVKASFGTRGLASLSSPSLDVDVVNDAFALGLDRRNCTCSSSLATPTMEHLSADAVSFTFASPAQSLTMNVTYELRPDADFISKTISLTDTGRANLTREVNAVSAMEGASLQSNGAASTDTRTASNVQFFRWPSTQAAASRTTGAFLTAQNQFVQSPSLAWTLDQNWTTLDPDGGAAVRTLDSAIIGLYEGSTSQLEFAETAAVTSAVSRYLVAPSEDNVTVKINIAWCENDYQLDISLADDRAAYKRIIDRAAEMGISHILFAPRNSDISSAANNTDPWGWEQLLWFGYGQKLRMGEWKPGDPLAASTQEMLDYFKLKGVKPVAYVYPILAFLAGTLPGGGSPPWIVQGTYDMSDARARDVSATLPKKQPPMQSAPPRVGAGGVLRSNLANEEFIQWLPETMVQFAEQTGAGGFSFDLTYWEEGLPVASEYAQWAGWRDILAQLHTKRGGKACAGSRCVVDNRQANHGWGAWMWALGGSYAEPLMSDEQPGSWPFYEADLHTDRLAGNKQRAIGKSYRDEYCPNEALPGFAFHQTDRDPTALQNEACSAGRCSNHSRARDFDLLGYRYSLLSSVGSGGLNNVMNMLPARDPQEFSLFPKEDLGFVRDWLAWADAHVALLKLTRPVPSLSTPGLGLADGTIMLRDDNSGAMFLFNPTARAINVSLPLSGDGSAALGFACGGATPPVKVRQVSSSERTFWAPYDLGLLDCADTLNLTLAPTSARVFEFDQWKGTTTPLLLGSPCDKAEVDASGTLTVSGARGERGTPTELRVVLPKGAPKVSKVVLNGQGCPFTSGWAHGLPAVVVRGAWGGARFGRAQEILPSSASSQAWSGKFSVPQSVIDQLKARNASYPIVYNTDPRDTDDANVPWLAPGRLLVFVKYATPIDDTLNITGAVDGQPLLVRKGYNTIVRNAGRFIGHWADVTPLVKPGAQQTLTLQLPGQKPLGVFFDNVETILTDSFATTA